MSKFLTYEGQILKDGAGLLNDPAETIAIPETIHAWSYFDGTYFYDVTEIEWSNPNYYYAEVNINNGEKIEMAYGSYEEIDKDRIGQPYSIRFKGHPEGLYPPDVYTEWVSGVFGSS